MLVYSNELVCFRFSVICAVVILQSLSSVLKKRVSVDKDHVKAIHKMTQNMHEDNNIKQLKFEG